MCHVIAHIPDMFYTLFNVGVNKDIQTFHIVGLCKLNNPRCTKKLFAKIVVNKMTLARDLDPDKVTFKDSLITHVPD